MYQKNAAQAGEGEEHGEENGERKRRNRSVKKSGDGEYEVELAEEYFTGVKEKAKVEEGEKKEEK